jgi:hypothetical protein
VTPWTIVVDYSAPDKPVAEELLVYNGAPEAPSVTPTTADLIASECDAIKEMLLSKNRKYGDSALRPRRVFSKASAVEQILVRIDDKLSRIESAQYDEDEDVEKDLIGYLVLLRIARRGDGCNGMSQLEKDDPDFAATEALRKARIDRLGED